MRCFCDRETRFYHSLTDAPNTRAPSLSRHPSLCFETLPESSSCFRATIWLKMGIWDGPGGHHAAAEMGNFAKTINLPPPSLSLSPSPCYASIMIGSVCQEPHFSGTLKLVLLLGPPSQIRRVMIHPGFNPCRQRS